MVGPSTVPTSCQWSFLLREPQSRWLSSQLQKLELYMLALLSDFFDRFLQVIGRILVKKESWHKKKSL